MINAIFKSGGRKQCSGALGREGFLEKVFLIIDWQKSRAWMNKWSVTPFLAEAAGRLQMKRTWSGAHK